jgi:hypothetical protein
MALLSSTIAAIFVLKQPPSPSRYGTPCTIQIAIPTAEVAAPLGTIRMAVITTLASRSIFNSDLLSAGRSAASEIGGVCLAIV